MVSIVHMHAVARRYVVPRQRQFRADLVVVNDCLDELIGLARQCSEPEDLEALQQRDYSKARIPPPPLARPAAPRPWMLYILQSDFNSAQHGVSTAISFVGETN